MAVDKLFSIPAFVGIAIGDTQTLPHGLVLRGVAIRPDRVDLQFPNSFQLVSSTTTEITIRNVNSGTGDCQAWVMAIHPATRLLGLDPDDGLMTQGLTPRPFSTGTESPAPPFPPVPVTTTIFVRTTGNDTTGTGSLVEPYRTSQRAFLDLPALSPVLPNHQIIVDPTGTGQEVFPAGYQFPVILAPYGGLTNGDPSTLPFQFAEAVSVRAQPQRATNIPLGQTAVLGSDILSIVGDVDTNLALVTCATVRAGWAANALKGKMVIGSGTDARTSCVIYGSDTTHLLLCNTAAQVASMPQQDLFIVEPSAEYHSLGVGNDGGGFEVSNTNSIIFQGIKFTVAGGGNALAVINAPQPFVELCDIDGLEVLAVPLQFGLIASVVRSNLDIEDAALTPTRSLLLQASVFYLCGAEQVFRQTVIDTCSSIGPGTFATTEGGLPAQGWEFFDCLFTGNTGADGAIFARGGRWSLENVRFDGGAGDAIQAVGSDTYMIADHITGATNTGGGIHTDDGAQCRVMDDATLVTGTAGDILCGTLPARTWTDFRTLVPVKNQYDLQSPFIANAASGLLTPGGDDVTGAGTGGCSGSRVFQRP